MITMCQPSTATDGFDRRHSAPRTGKRAELLYDAIWTVVAASEMAGGRLVVVDAVRNQAVHFYEHFGFIRIGETLRLYAKISRLRNFLPS